MRSGSLTRMTVLLAAAFASEPAAEAAAVLEEASGLVRQGEALLIVSDHEPGVYYRYPISGDEVGAVTLDPRRLQQVGMPNAALALDLESIGVLADGRVVVLSERLRALIAEDGVVAEYGGALAEFGNRGAEGLAIQSLANRHSRVAILWEGGYPEYDLVPDELKDLVGRRPLRPVVWIHDLAPAAKGMTMRGTNTEGVLTIELAVPDPDRLAPPDGQRFRAPALLWHRIQRDETVEDGFIVLLNSGNAPVSGSTRYTYLWLQRFRLDGQPFGAPLDLKALLPPGMKDRNWEGLAWFESGKSVVLIHDVPPPGTPAAYVVRLPEDWR